MDPSLEQMAAKVSKGAHRRPTEFSLRALTARRLLQQRKALCCCAARKPAFHACRGQNDPLKDQVADKADLWGIFPKVHLHRSSNIASAARAQSLLASTV